MTLGEKIYKLRTQNKLSQGDLANELNVSRQSISKWENDNSTPDLEKIVKLSEIFNVSLDELVKNEEKEEANVNTTEHFVINKNIKEKKIAKGLLITGIILMFLFPLLNLGILGVFVAIPFLICSLIYYKAKSNQFILCLWTIFPIADIFVRIFMGIGWSDVKRTLQWDYSLNYGRLAIAWVQFVLILFLIIFSSIKLSKNSYEINKKFKKNFIASGTGFVVLEIVPIIISFVLSKTLTGYELIDILSDISYFVNGATGVLEWFKFYLLTDFISKTISIIRNKNKN